ncbi:hypothetical protein [Streptomyces chartreusis]|uniref:hypothetical protein n=1 Tax=Streptomyces chartreusis TaxID=1969 RepID=UPI003800D228
MDDLAANLSDVDDSDRFSQYYYVYRPPDGAERKHYRVQGKNPELLVVRFLHHSELPGEIHE